MAKYRLTGPDGSSYEVSAPDSASQAEVMQFFQTQQAGRSKKFADDAAADRAEYAPTVGMSGTEKFLSGAGKAFSDLGRGVGQIVGAVPQADIDETKKLDAPLMNTGAGVAGNVTGNIAAAVPAAFIPGAQGLAGATLVGAGMGAAQPVASDESRLTNTLIGGAGGAAGVGAGKLIGKTAQVIRGPAQAPEMKAAVNAAREAGYVIPPTQANPTLANRVMEGVAGKLTTAQNASAKNQQVTNRMAARALGLAEDQPITPEALKGVRESASKAYETVRGLGPIQADAKFAEDLMSITNSAKNAGKNFPGLVKSDIDDVVASLNQKQFDSGGAVDAMRILRDRADSAFAQGDKSASKAYKAASNALESQLERSLSEAGNPEALAAFREARTLIAKSYSVEKAMNQTSGNVDARKLAAQLAKGKPLSGELRDAAEFSARFPKATQAVEGMGSLPQTSPLDWAASGGISAATGNPLMMAGVAARPGARALTLSNLVQNRLARPDSASALSSLLAGPGPQALAPYAAQIGRSSVPALTLSSMSGQR